MKKLLVILTLCTLPLVAMAAGLTPPGLPGDLAANGDGEHFTAFGVGNGLSKTTSGGKTYLNATVTSGLPTDLSAVTTGFYDANTGTVPAANYSPLYRDPAGGISGLTVNGSNETAQLFGAANMQDLITQQLVVDPRLYGAVCNAQENAGGASIATGTPNLYISGHTWTTAEIGDAVALNAGGSNPSGTGETTVINIGPAGAYAILANNATTNIASGGWVVWGHNDTAYIQNAINFSGPYWGGYITAPQACLISDVNLASGANIHGYAGTRAYPASGGIPGNLMVARPVWFYLATGFSADSTSHFMFNISGTENNSIDGITLEGLIFPFEGTPGTYAGHQGTFIGTATGNAGAGTMDGFKINGNVTMTNMWNGIGGAYGTPNSAFITMNINDTNFINMGWGMEGQFQDTILHNLVFTGGYSQGHMDFENSNSIRGENFRTEEARGVGLAGVVFNNSESIHFNDFECQFPATGVYCFIFSGSYSGITFTGGFAEGGSPAYMHFEGPGSSSGGSYYGGVSFDNFLFEQENYSGGTATSYLADSTSASLSGLHLSITGGFACSQSWTASMFNWGGTAPTFINVDTSDCPRIRTGLSDVTWVNGALGLSTSSIHAGAIFDALNGTGTGKSSMILPGDSTTNRPTTGVAGMLRYNTSTSGPEFYNSSWNALTYSTTVSPAAGYVLTSTTTGGQAASWQLPNGLPNQTGQTGNYLFTNGTIASWAAVTTSANIAIGSSTTGANPSIAGDATSGFYTPAAAQVGIVSGGHVDFLATTTSSAVNYITFVGEPTGSAPIITAGGSDTNGAGLGIAFKALNATATGAGGGITFTAGQGLNATGTGGSISFTAGAGASGGGANTAPGGAISFTSGAASSSANTGGALTFTGGAGNNSAGGLVSLTGGNTTGDNNGGAILITGGNGPGNNPAGSVSITGGPATGAAETSAATGGLVTIAGGSGTNNTGFLEAPAGSVVVTGGTAYSGPGGNVTVEGSNAVGSFNAAGGNLALISGNAKGTAAPGTFSLTAGNAGTIHIGASITLTSGNGGSTSGNSGNINLNVGTVTSGTVGAVILNAPLTYQGYTVSTLPSGSIGMNAYVTDATACTFLSTPTGGGSTVCPVFNNGSAWVAQ